MANKAYVFVLISFIIPILAAVTQYLNVALMPQAPQNDGNDQMANTMKSMNIMMPLMSAVFCWSLPSGMGIYWIAGAVIRSIQQVLTAISMRRIRALPRRKDKICLGNISKLQRRLWTTPLPQPARDCL